MKKTEPNAITLTVDQLRLVKDILSAYLPLGTTVWVFGSRATGKAKTFSDLDLLFDHAGNPLSALTLLNMAEAFDESALPYKVDLVDWNNVSDTFKAQIQDSRIVILP